MSDNAIHDAERDEWRSARYFAERDGIVECYRHNWVPDGRGGGACRYCSATVSAGEIQ